MFPPILRLHLNAQDNQNYYVVVALGGRRLIREPNTAEIPVPGAPSTTAPKPAHRAHTAATVAFSGLTVSCLSLPDGLGQMWL